MALVNQLPPLVGPPPVLVEVEPSHSTTHHSIETLVVVLAVITILGVIAGILARLCGGRHLGGSGEHDEEGCVERKCRSCIDGGVTTSAPPPPPPKEEQPKPAATVDLDQKTSKPSYGGRRSVELLLGKISIPTHTCTLSYLQQEDKLI